MFNILSVLAPQLERDGILTPIRENHSVDCDGCDGCGLHNVDGPGPMYECNKCNGRGWVNKPRKD